MNEPKTNIPNVNRRGALSVAGVGLLSVAAVGVLGASSAMAKAGSATAADADILNVALGLEHEAIAAYQVGAGSGLLQKPALDAAVLFQSHHKAHRDALIGAIKQLGGAPVDPKSMDQYAAALGVSAIKSQTDVLRLAAKLERGAANAYLGVIPSFKNSAFAQVAGRLAADEVMHWTVLSSVLGDSLPSSALTFGA
ncbi:MAG: ferritin-like domain-containing protein [Pseudomonadota bacterium]|jgi:hypothetical protein